MTAERDRLLSVLREKGRDEGDVTLVHQVAIWRHRAELNGQRQALAERALRALSSHWLEAKPEVTAWQVGTNQTERRTA